MSAARRDQARTSALVVADSAGAALRRQAGSRPRHEAEEKEGCPLGAAQVWVCGAGLEGQLGLGGIKEATDENDPSSDALLRQLTPTPLPGTHTTTFMWLAACRGWSD